MTVEIRDVEIGPCPARTYEQASRRWAVILPGARYLPDAPLLWFAREAALAAGYDVMAVWDTYDRRGDAQQWVAERLTAALQQVPDLTPLLIAKSLTTLATGAAAERRLPAVWLTPLIAAAHPASGPVVAGLRAATAPALLVGGAADESWDPAIARAVPHGTVLEIADADHVLQVAGDIGRSLDALRTVATAVREFATDRLAE